MGSDKDSLTAKTKAAHTRRAKEISFTVFLGQSVVQPSQGKLDSIMCNGDLGRQKPSLQTSLLPPPSPALNPDHDVIWMAYPFVIWGQLSQPCPLSASCAPPAYCQGGTRYRKDLDIVQANPVFSTNSNHKQSHIAFSEENYPSQSQHNCKCSEYRILEWTIGTNSFVLG